METFLFDAAGFLRSREDIEEYLIEVCSDAEGSGSLEEQIRLLAMAAEVAQKALQRLSDANRSP